MKVLDWALLRPVLNVISSPYYHHQPYYHHGHGYMVIITTALIIIIIMLEEALEEERVLPWARFNLAAKSLVPLHIHPHTQYFHHIVITIS